VYYIALRMHFLSCRLLRCLVSLDYICKYDTSFTTIVKLTRIKAFAITSTKIVADFYHISYLLKIKDRYDELKKSIRLPVDSICPS
jgi:hypothetical protein